MITLANIKKAIYCLNKRIDLLEQNGGSGGVSYSEVTELQNKVTALESIISEGENPTAAIDKFNEIVAFLNSIQNTDTLSGLLQDIISQIPDAQIQSDWNQTNTSAKDYIKNKPTIPSLTEYATEQWVRQQGYLTLHQDISGKVNSSDLAAVATSGDYADLINKPTIPAAQIQSDWNQSDNTAKDFIKNKPSVIERSEMGVASGIATLDENGHIPSEQMEGDYLDVVADAFAQQQAEINALRSMLTDISSKINISTRLVDSEEYYKVGVPTILYCSGVPNATNIPLNWNSNIMGEWTGVPRFIGQMYIDISSSKLFMSKQLTNSTGDWFQV